MSLQTTLLRCPGCGTVFRGPPTLPAHGKVRCGVCSEVFAVEAGPFGEPAGDLGRGDAPRPAYVSPDAARRRGAGGRLLRVALVLALCGQVGWLARNRLAESSLLRPLLDKACARLDCRLPAYRDLSVIRVGEARVTSHPDYAGALLAVVTLDNTGPLEQPWPRLALALTGAGEAAVAERVFEPADYLPAERQAEAGFAAGGSVEVRLPLADPGTQAGGFRFTLR
jgi:hypothetical protein